MGREAVTAIAGDARFVVAGVLVRDVSKLPDALADIAYEDAQRLLTQARPQVWLDLTDARSVVGHADLALSAGVRPVLGATGYGDEDIARWQAVCEQQQIGGIAAPNFAVGALLMVRFAAEAARFYAHSEVIELHHDGKRDAPSGTARRTAEAIGEARAAAGAKEQGVALSDAEPAVLRDNPGQAQTSAGAEGAPAPRREVDGQPARGLDISGVPVHSVRLPGLVAHQEVLFGGTGETLTIRHDSLSRSSFMPGILYALEKVMDLRQFVYGLEHLMW